MTPRRDRAWIGVDVGKTHHWVYAVDDDGRTLLSKKIPNDEADILATIATIATIATARSLAEKLVWAVDIIGAPSALLLALLAQAGLTVRYASGRWWRR